MAEPAQSFNRLKVVLERTIDTTLPHHDKERLRSKAEEFALKHAIENSELERSSGSFIEEPEHLFVPVYEREPLVHERILDLSEFLSYYTRTKLIQTEKGVLFFGYPVDIGLCDLYIDSLSHEIRSSLCPAAREDLSYEENLIRLKEAGLAWKEIHEELQRVGAVRQEFTRNIAVRFTKDYTRACRELGRDRMYEQPSTKKKRWLDWFVSSVRGRVRSDWDRRNELLKSHTKGRGFDKILQHRHHKVNSLYNMTLKGSADDQLW